MERLRYANGRSRPISEINPRNPNASMQAHDARMAVRAGDIAYNRSINRARAEADERYGPHAPSRSLVRQRWLTDSPRITEQLLTRRDRASELIARQRRRQYSR